MEISTRTEFWKRHARPPAFGAVDNNDVDGYDEYDLQILRSLKFPPHKLCIIRKELTTQ
jgi:hypothetical protein